MIFSACTYEPDSAWVCQQARNVCMEMQDLEIPISAVIHDRDSKFTSQVDAVFKAEGAKVALTPYRSPRANSIVERLIKTTRRECLDLLHRRRAPSSARPHRVLRPLQQCATASRSQAQASGRGPHSIYRQDRAHRTPSRNHQRVLASGIAPCSAVKARTHAPHACRSSPARLSIRYPTAVHRQQPATAIWIRSDPKAPIAVGHFCVATEYSRLTRVNLFAVLHDAG